MQQKMTFYLFILGLICACSQEHPKEPDAERNLELLWMAPISNGYHEFSIASDPVVHENHVIVSAEFDMDGVKSPLMFLDSSNGNRLHLWSDYIKGTALYANERARVSGDYLVLSTQRSMDCVNLKTRQRQWATIIPDNNPFNWVDDDFVYTTVNFKDGRSAAILRCPIETGIWDTVFTFHSPGSFEPDFCALGFGELTGGDKVLAWKSRRAATGKDRTDIFAYNLSADTLLWRNTEYSVFAGVAPVIIEQNRVLVLLEEIAVSLNVTTGNTLWSRDFDGVVKYPDIANFDQYLVAYHAGKVILKGSGSELVYLNWADGSVEKVIDAYPRSGYGEFTFFEDKIFFTTGDLVIADAQTGEPLISPQSFSPVNGPFIYTSITIDPDRRVLYCHDGFHLYCVKIPDDL